MSAESEELEACPFCGAMAEFTAGYWNAGRWHPAKIMCENKHTFRNYDNHLGKDDEAAARLISEWNARPIAQSADTARIAELEAALASWLHYDGNDKAGGVEMMFDYDNALTATRAALNRSTPHD